VPAPASNRSGERLGKLDPPGANSRKIPLLAVDRDKEAEGERREPAQPARRWTSALWAVAEFAQRRRRRQSAARRGLNLPPMTLLLAVDIGRAPKPFWPLRLSNGSCWPLRQERYPSPGPARFAAMVAHSLPLIPLQTETPSHGLFAVAGR